MKMATCGFAQKYSFTSSCEQRITRGRGPILKKKGGGPWNPSFFEIHRPTHRNPYTAWKFSHRYLWSLWIRDSRDPWTPRILMTNVQCFRRTTFSRFNHNIHHTSLMTGWEWLFWSQNLEEAICFKIKYKYNPLIHTALINFEVMMNTKCCSTFSFF